jgi:predicted dehydrogenase
MKKAVIIGAGQLGSRHLQGLLSCKIKQEIIIFDLSINSLDISKKRALEINNDHNLIFTDNWEDIPTNIDLAIISTNSNVRFEILEKLFIKSNVNNILLEKVLFQSISDFASTEILQKNYPFTNLWVNHPRRMSSFYKNIKSRLNNNNDKILSVSISGMDWGLACNSLHFIDLVTFLIDSELKSMNTSYLNKRIEESKRIGFIEFNGTITGEFNDNTFITLNSSDDESVINVSKKIYINIVTKFENIFICEEKYSNVIYQGKKPEINTLIFDKFDLKLQSELTAEIAEEIYKINSCKLPTFKEAKVNHIIFINSLLEFYNKLNSSNFLKLPIT